MYNYQIINNIYFRQIQIKHYYGVYKDHKHHLLLKVLMIILMDLLIIIIWIIIHYYQQHQVILLKITGQKIKLYHARSFILLMIIFLLQVVQKVIFNLMISDNRFIKEIILILV